MIYTLADISESERVRAGGKGAVLAKLFQLGYPVPDGILILADAFDESGLRAEAWQQVQTKVQAWWQENPDLALAVRSSALSEDSAQASFAGEFETVLNVVGLPALEEAIQKVYDSRSSERVRAYSEAHGLTLEHHMGVVIQHMVPAHIAGVMFTADPIHGDWLWMVGDFVYGLGEALVSGEANAQQFKINRWNKKYKGPTALKGASKQLVALGNRLLVDFEGIHQDIEWVLTAEGQVYLVQSRPITTLHPYDAQRGSWNSALSGDFLWANTNFGEAFPEAMTPFTWSLMSDVINAQFRMEKGRDLPFLGNIGGHMYFNYGSMLDPFASMPLIGSKMRDMFENLMGPLPEGFDYKPTIVPLVIIPRFLQRLIVLNSHARKHTALIPQFMVEIGPRIKRLEQALETTEDLLELLRLYQERIRPMNEEAVLILTGPAQEMQQVVQSLFTKLTKLMGKEDATRLISGFSQGNHYIASLGPLVGLAEVAAGQMSREHYTDLYGHRCPNETEFAQPRPFEEPGWLDKRLAEHLEEAKQAVTLLDKQRQEHQEALARLNRDHPRRAKRLQAQLEQLAELAELRETIRSQGIRGGYLVRQWMLKVGQLTGLGDDIFMLQEPEILQFLETGDERILAVIPMRWQGHKQNQALPVLPAFINGRFHPHQWAQEPHRRTDFYDAHTPIPDIQVVDTIRGVPGAVGVVEGRVRVLQSMAESADFESGEILVAVSTNVGWTLLFPRAAAVVTDVGAALSHAAIVARELGIPAVVGCGHATMQLKTGDYVRVNGAEGVVEVIEREGEG